MADKDHIIIESGDAVQPFAYAVGMQGSKFFTELKNRKFYGLRCPRARRCTYRRAGCAGTASWR